MQKIFDTQPFLETNTQQRGRLASAFLSRGGVATLYVLLSSLAATNIAIALSKM
jgi:hypothetical protein